MVLQLLHEHIQDALVECVAVVFFNVIIVQRIGTLYLTAVQYKVTQQDVEDKIPLWSIVARSNLLVHILHHCRHGVCLATLLCGFLVQVEAVAHEETCIFGAVHRLGITP